MGVRELVALAALAFGSAPAFATTYLCIGEAGAAVEHGGNQSITAGLYEATKHKYVLSDASGSWQLRVLGEDTSILKCVSQYYCEVPDGFSAYFIKERESNVFTYVGLVGTGRDEDNWRSTTFVIKGRCSSL